MDGDLHGLVGAFAMDALSDEERATFEQHLRHCDQCSKELSSLRETLASVSLAAQEPPPEGLRARVLAAVEYTPQERGVLALRARPPRMSKLLAGIAALLSVAVVGLGLATARTSQQVNQLQGQLATSSAQAEAAEAQLAASSAQAEVAEAQLAASEAGADAAQGRLVSVMTAPDARTVELSGDRLRARLVYSVERQEGAVFDEDMPALPPGMTYQFWLIGADRATSAGTFKPDPEGQVALSLDRDFTAAEAVGVSIEPDGGSPQPTTVLLTGTLA